MAETAPHALLEKRIERAVQAQLQPLHEQLLAQHTLLIELVRQLPRPALLSVAQQLEQTPLPWPATARCNRPSAQQSWHLYLCQLAALVEGDTPPPCTLVVHKPVQAMHGSSNASVHHLQGTHTPAGAVRHRVCL